MHSLRYRIYGKKDTVQKAMLPAVTFRSLSRGKVDNGVVLLAHATFSESRVPQSKYTRVKISFSKSVYRRRVSKQG